MLAAPVVADLFQRHVLWSGEEIEKIQEQYDELTLTTRLRHFVIGSERDDWRVGVDNGIRDVVIATRDDLVIHGQPERFGFLLLSDGRDVYVNDAESFADLGTRLLDGMDPIAYAELLVRFHPYSNATRAVLTRPHDLQRIYQRDDLPAVSPFRSHRTPHGVTLMFTSSIRYRRAATGTLLDLADWTVTVPVEGPARWESRLTVAGILLDAA
jgi:hypothetical protein